MNAFYDSYDYVSYWKNRSYEDNSERIVLERIFKKISCSGRLVDIGGGFGRLCSTYSSFFDKCEVIDPSENNLQTGKEIFKQKTNVSFKKGSLPDLDYADKTFDTALLIRVSHHLRELSPSLKEIHRILKDNGYLILEVANKIHFWAKIKAVLRFDFKFSSCLDSVERRSKESIKEGKILFLNHHPQKIISEMKNNGFEIIEIFSVSNFRSSILKKIFPKKILLFFEKAVQKFLAKYYFGPSIFILAQKI